MENENPGQYPPSPEKLNDLEERVYSNKTEKIDLNNHKEHYLANAIVTGGLTILAFGLSAFCNYLIFKNYI